MLSILAQPGPSGNASAASAADIAGGEVCATEPLSQPSDGKFKNLSKLSHLFLNCGFYIVYCSSARSLWERFRRLCC
jgi:hypothetical protein